MSTEREREREGGIERVRREKEEREGEVAEFIFFELSKRTDIIRRRFTIFAGNLFVHML